MSRKPGTLHFGPERQYQRKGDGGQWADKAPPTRQLQHPLQIALSPLTLLTGALRVLRKFPFRASLEDHLPQHYIAALTPPGVRSEFGD